MYAFDDYSPPCLWPAFIEKKFIERTLAYLEDDRLYLETGDSTPVGEHLLSLLFDCNLLTFVTSLAPYLALIRQAGGTIYCTDEGLATSARIKGASGTTRWLVVSSQWGYATPSLSMLTELRRLFDHAGVGTLNSFGSLGSALFRDAWRRAYGPVQYADMPDNENHDGKKSKNRGKREIIDPGWMAHRHQRPPRFACTDFYKHSTGARSELLTTLKEFSELIEIDEKNAYLDKLRLMPTGRTIRFLWGKVSGFAAWVGNVVITIKEKLSYGIFPFKRSPQETTSYPTEPGEYPVWAGNRTVELAQREGCEVKILDGWGWWSLTDEPKHIVELCSLLRDTCPDARTEELFKVCIVAAIGCLGMRPEHYELVEERQSKDDRPALNDDGFQSTLWIHVVHDKRPASMPHWMQYALEGCRLRLYELAKPFVEAEFAVATNTDAVYVLPEAQPIIDLMTIRKKAEKRETGDEGYRHLHPRAGHRAVELPFTRGLVSAEKTTLPGTTYEAYMERKKSLLGARRTTRRPRLVGPESPDFG